MNVYKKSESVSSGCRPLVEIASHPFWASFASRFRKEKLLLLFSLGSLIVFTLAIGFVQVFVLEFGLGARLKRSQFRTRIHIMT